MAFTNITDDDLAGKGTVGMADTPNLTAPEMQAKFDELPNLVINKFKTHITEESLNTAASNTGAVDPTTGGEATNIQGVLDNLQTKKQEKETGKGLSANDFTDTYKNELDTAFENNHTHSNKGVLDLITSAVKTAYDRLVSLFTNITSITTTVNGSDTALPTAGAISRYVQQMGGGDMVKSIYDTDNDGIVDHAEIADALQNPIAATAVTYNHTASGLTAENAQAAIDEVHNEAKNSVQTSAIENDLLGTDATKVLAAPQGKVLDGKITTINSNLGGTTFSVDANGAYVHYTPTGGADPVVKKLGNGFELLWTNPSPSSVFAAQTLTLDLSKYKYVAIECSYTTTADYRTICLQPIPSKTGGTGEIHPRISANYLLKNNITSRLVTLNSSGIYFGSGEYALDSNSNNVYCIPLKIYGIADIM